MACYLCLKGWVSVKQMGQLFEELKRRNVLRVAAAYVVASWLVIQVVETIFPAFGFGDAAIRIATIVLAIGLIPALILAWAFEITPEGLKKEKDVDRSQSITPHTDKKLDRMIIVVLALALGYFALDKFVLSPQREAAQQQQQAEQLASATEEARQEGRSEALVESYGEKSIAVLPFVDMSPDKDQEYMADGIAEELPNLLAKIPELRVISRSSAFSFKGKDIDIPTIAEQLNVAHILEGSIRKAGDRIRITTQLIEARSDTHLWSETYDRVLDDIFGIQDEIAQEVVDELKFTLLDDTPQAAQTDPEAYEQYLVGQHLMHQRTKTSIEQATIHFERALHKDPAYAPAHAVIAVAWMLLQDSARTYGDLPLEEAVAKALPAAQRALELDPDLAEAHAAMGFIQFQQQNFEETLSSWDRAVDLNPNFALVYSWRGILLGDIGKYQQELESLRAATELDPLSANVLNNYAIALFQRGRYDESDNFMQRIKAIGPAFYYYMKSWQAWQRGMPSEAIFALLDGFDIDPNDRRMPGGLTNMFGLLGIHDEALRHATGSLRYLPYQWISDWQTVLEIRKEEYARNADSRRAMANLGQALLASGDVEPATPLLERYVKGFADGVGPNTLVAGYIALIRKANGDEKGAEEIHDALTARHERALAGGLDNNAIRTLEAMISLIEGRQEDALAALDGLSHGMGIEPQVVASLRLLTPVNDDAQFDEILATQENHFAEERQRLTTRICGNDARENWQPLPETCAGQHPVE